MKPRRTPWGVVSQLESRIEQLGEERHRARLDALVPALPVCTKHGWSPPSPRPLSDNREALASTCPFCRTERREAERKAEAPEVRTLDVYAGSVREQTLWEEQKRRRMEAGEILPATTVEREVLRVLDDERRIEVAGLRETPQQRRNAHRDYWSKKLRVHRQQYQRHPARAGP